MEFYLILALIIVTMVAVFAIQNAHVVMIHFLFWHFEGSLVLYLLSFFTAGIITALLLTLPDRLKKRRAYREKIEALEKDIARAKPPEEKTPGSPPAI
ncbi:MAG: LapA family protein [Thermodesulfobacteriota bacterium]|nr:LapA family protein [Thermodesulfobacteriota bacterium]